ncbi:unnamed protein product [Toxocara canis]|uniref:Kazal-like domain-containing protein n=1 Tax=Toxocara canis TaxID=6265 RepID=A0A183VH14_TOXCA|nr:unnamed protein product [Toxocara canis]
MKLLSKTENNINKFESNSLNSSGQCECKTSCHETGPIVCGTDNVTYASECHLSVRSCLLWKVEKREIRVKNVGACGMYEFFIFTYSFNIIFVCSFFF